MVQLKTGHFGVIYDNNCKSKNRLIKFNDFVSKIDVSEILSASDKGQWKIVKWDKNANQ